MDLINMRQARRFLQGVTLGFLAQHLIFVVLFVSRGGWLMGAVNLICALAVGVCLRLFSRGMPRAFMLTLYGTELVSICFCAVCLGWSAGFQLPLVGQTLLLFYAEYLGRVAERRTLPVLPLSLGSLAAYLFVFVPRFHGPGLQPLPEDVLTTVQLVWSVLAFGLCIAGFTIVVRMNTDSERVLIGRAESDRLTGLYNRAGYEQLLTRIELRSTTLLLVDADKFKHVNDTYGHAAGDRVLKKIALALVKNFRRVDYVCRIGGDEFVVLMLNTDSPERELFLRKANRINRELSHTEDGLPLSSVSIGVAWGGDAADWKELFDHADAALYEVKQAGGRDCRFYERA